MDRTEKARELLERAAKLGVRLDFDSGFIVAVKRSGDPERQDSLLTELAMHVRDVRPLVEQRAIDAGANKFLGARILYPEFTLTQVRALEGLISSAHGNGAVVIEVRKEGFRDPKVLVTARAESLLIVLDEEADGGSSPADQKGELEPPRKRLFGLI